jgi:transcriptional regulator with XRE-family HTH domain
VIGMADEQEPLPAEQLLRENLEQIRAFRRMSQAALADRLGKSQSWVSKRLAGKLNGKGSRFQFEDLDRLAAIFGLSPAELLQPGYGKRDRRTGRDRRSGFDRRSPSRTPPAADTT